MKDNYDCLKLKNQLCFPIYLCSKEIIRRYTPILKKINLTYTQYIVMMYFWEKEQSNVRDISNALLLDSSTLTPLLVKLETKGFITRTKSKMDGRNLDLVITEKGVKLKEEALSVPQEMRECIDLSKDEIKVLYKLINKVLINVERN